MFQSTPARGGRRASYRLQPLRKCFNPRPHAAGDTPANDPAPWGHVSIHARTRRATSRHCAHATRALRFNPRPHAAGDGEDFRLRGRAKRFNPRPHAAGDPLAARLDVGDYVVSIHARTRRATPRFPFRPRMGNVSIHARTRRATHSFGYCTIFDSFQSTPARGGRLRATRFGCLLDCFNPRPHAAGDLITDPTCNRLVMFQSTPARGGRPLDATHATACTSFQSTPARGGRPEISFQAEDGQCFNPRPHAAGDAKIASLRSANGVSIHARTRRATRCGLEAAGVDLVSIHARTRRATEKCQATTTSCIVSIHARTRRATSRAGIAGGGKVCFNPRPHAAGDQNPGDESPA